jgi:hypothetical protein
MLSHMAKRMPRLEPRPIGLLRLKGFGNRILFSVFWTAIILISGSGFAKDMSVTKTLQFLQLGFSEKTEPVQRKLLRDMALLDSEEAIPFFVSVAMDTNYKEEARREALKGMLAVDSTKYRMALEVLQVSPLDENLLLKNMQMVPGLNLMETFMKSLTFFEEPDVIDVKLKSVLRYWNENVFKGFDFSTWPSLQASENLSRNILGNMRTEHRVNLIHLWSKVRDEKSTRELVKVLDQPNPRVQEAMILALSEPGPNAVSALGRFLQKSKDATLRKRAIYALRKINTSASKTALKSYEPQATKEEKIWIDEILAN